MHSSDSAPVTACPPHVLSPALWRHPAFRQGVRAYQPVAIGVAAWGLTTGVAMGNSGLSVLEALAMTLLVFAGTAQLAAISLIAAGAPLWVIVAAAACVNVRFVVFSLHLREYVQHLPLSQRLLVGYLSGDINYVLLIQRYPHAAGVDDGAGQTERIAWYIGNTGSNYVTWCTSCCTGVLLARFFPAHWGLGFAGTLAVLGVLCAMLDSRLRVLAAVLAGSAAVLLAALPLKLNLLAGIAVAVVLCMALEAAVTPGVRGQRQSTGGDAGPD